VLAAGYLLYKGTEADGARYRGWKLDRDEFREWKITRMT
jgi:hypothetical protein